jgi:type IV fimbrial biogenesis protein FimT
MPIEMLKQRHDNACSTDKSAGFSLIELMVGLAMLGILVSIAVPSLRQFIVRSSFEGTVLDLRGAIGRARAEAIARGTVVSFAPPTAGDWMTGYEVFVDPMQRGVFTAADTVGTGTDVRAAERLQVGTVPQNSSLSWPVKTSDGTSNSNLFFAFDSRGRPITTTGVFGNGSLPVCIPSAIQATNNCREIVVDVVGRVRVNSYTKSL